MLRGSKAHIIKNKTKLILLNNINIETLNICYLMIEISLKNANFRALLNLQRNSANNVTFNKQNTSDFIYAEFNNSINNNCNK